MKSILSIAMAVLVSGASALIAAQPAQATAILNAYAAVSKALADDDLAAAKKAATELKTVAADNQAIVEYAGKLAESATLDGARDHFKTISAEAVKLAQGKSGYFVITCPMANADWVQTDKEIKNPYMGKTMLECGSIKAGDGAAAPARGCCSMTAI